jgi:hypothetical protein
MPNEMVMEPPEAVLQSPPSIVTAPPLVLPSLKARVKIPLLLVADNQEMIDASHLAAPDELPAGTLNTPPMSVPEPAEIAMLPPEPDADKPLQTPKAPLLPTTLAVPVFINRSPNMPAVPALLFVTATLLALVALPTPDEIVMEQPEAILPLVPAIVTAPPLCCHLLRPESSSCHCWSMTIQKQWMHPLWLLAACNKLPAFTLNAPPMLVPEPTEIAMLPPKPDADKPLPTPKVPLLPTLAIPVIISRSPNTAAVPALLVDSATLSKIVAVPTPNEMVMEPPEAILSSPPTIVTAPLLELPSPKGQNQAPATAGCRQSRNS